MVDNQQASVWRKHLIAAAAILAVLLSSCSPGDEAPPSPTGAAISPPASPQGPQLPAPAAGEDLYPGAEAIPPGDPGRLVRIQPLDAPAGSRAWRVLYHSTAVDGRDVVVSGLIFAPDTPAEPGSRAVVSWGHASVGLGDRCAPSLVPQKLTDQRVFSELLRRDLVVTATDYEGLGTPGAHPWLVGLSEGRGVLDIVRAAGQIPETGAGSRFVAFGASQGGGAALFAGELARQYAPELELLGVVAAAPAAELDLLALEPPENLAGIGGFVVMGAFGFSAAYPELALEEILHPQLIAQREEVEILCQTEIDRLFRNLPLASIVKAPPGSAEGWAGVIAQNTPGHRATPAPVLVIHGDRDRVVPMEVSQLLFQRLCGLGVSARLQVYPGVDHSGVVGAADEDILGWIGDLAAGTNPEPPPGASSCS